MKAIDIARKLAALEQAEDACRAYTLAIHENAGQDPALDMEAALYVLGNGGDYKVSYTCFRNLYNGGHFREDVLAVMTEAFYAPNEEELRARYERNCSLLKKYPYCFREDFVPFEDLPIRFYPYDDDGYLPFYRAEERFGEYIDFKDTVISRNFFKDLEKPILAEDVYSQYELEYLCDNVRKSEYVGRENHLYLHYTDWGTFCAYLQCLDMGPLMREKKPVFLIGEEISQYPIDFKERFGIDYSKYPVRPLNVREVNRLIWHTQLSTHNGGDFFNEIFDGHPNLLFYNSLLFSNMETVVINIERDLKSIQSMKDLKRVFYGWPLWLSKQLYEMKNRTLKDVMVGLYLRDLNTLQRTLDRNSRIVPAIFFQPHFPNVKYDLRVDENAQRAVLYSKQYEKIREAPFFQGFKYIKTFTPMRRPTTSYGAAIKFMANELKEIEDSELENSDEARGFDDALFGRVLNRSFMIDPEDRLYHDSILVRFEDGKLNPKATFRALAAFLDLPYTESMTYCSDQGERDPESYKGNARGFDPVAVYRTYDDFANREEKTFLEGFLQEAYQYYGYDFHYYDGKPIDQARAEALIDGFTVLDGWILKTMEKFYLLKAETPEGVEVSEDSLKAEAITLARSFLDAIKTNRRNSTKILLRGLRFVNLQGQPLRFMPKLELDPALLEQPLYH